MAKKSKQQTCPCGSEKNYLDCCGRYIEQQQRPATSEALMRSRYTAYVLKNEPYLLASWHESTRPVSLELGNDQAKWTGLKIIATENGQTGDETGSVEFIARFKINGKAERLHEVSRFRKDNQQWFYVDGEIQ